MCHYDIHDSLGRDVHSLHTDAREPENRIVGNIVQAIVTVDVGNITHLRSEHLDGSADNRLKALSKRFCSLSRYFFKILAISG